MTVLGSNFYFPPSRLNFLVQLRSLLTQNKIVAIEGGIGIGKTVLLEEVLTTSMPDANKCYVTASKNITDVQLRSRIIEQLFGNVLFDPEKPLISSFIEFNQQQELMVAIDNAHFLSAKLVGELLQVFSELNGSGIHFSVVLSFDKSISTTLLNIQSQLLEIASVPSLTKDESYQLLEAYFSELPPTSDTKVKRWIENAKGIPIQLLAYNDRSNLETTNSDTLNIKLWSAFVAAASLLLAIVIYAYNVGYFGENEEAIIATDTDGASAVIQVLNANKNVAGDFIELNPSNQTPIEHAKLASSEEILAALVVAEQHQKIGLAAIEPVNNADKINSVSEAKSVEQTPQMNNTQELSGSNRESSASLSSDQGNKNVANDVNGATDQDLVVATATENYPEMPQSSLYQFQNDLFLSLPAEQYVLQFTAVSSEKTLAQYLESAPVAAEKFKIYKIKRNDADWIVVTYGLFKTIKEARAVAQALEPNAWAKSVAAIQQQINTFNARFDKTE